MTSCRWAWAGLLAAVVFCNPLAAAQENPQVDAVLDVMPDMSDRFESVDDFMKEGKWDRALEKLAEIAEEAGDTVWSGDGKVYVSVREFTRQRIIAMPPEGLAYYRATYDSEAKALFQEGVAKQDAALLDSVEQKYPASTYAEAALDASANVLIDLGNYSGAAARLERLLARPAAKADTAAETRLRAMAAAKLAFCSAKLGRDKALRAAVALLQKLGNVGPVRVAGGREDAVAFAKAELERGPVRSVALHAGAWTSPGGSANHLRPTWDVRPDLSKRWEVKIGDDSPAAKTVAPQYGYNPYGVAGMAPTVSPLPASDDEGVVYVNTGKGVYAIDHITGRLRWVAKPGPAPTVQPNPMGFMPFQNRFVLASWRAWPGSVSVSVGGGRVYAVEILGENWQGCLALSAFDAGSGRRVWSYQQKPDGGDFETAAFFPWAPKYIDGNLIGTACYRDQMFLCSLDAATAKINWKVFLSADPVQSTAAFGYGGMRAKRNYGSPAAIDEGVAYAATDTGAVAAVDIRSGQLLWISRYPRSTITVNRAPGVVGYTRYQQKAAWEGGFPVVADGRLYVAAADCNSLLAFDCATGAVVQEIPRGEFTYFAGYRDGSLILLGPETAAIDARTGLYQWLVPTAAAREGTPVLTESCLVVPLRGKLCSVRLEGEVVRTLEPVRDANTKLPLGNVVSCEGRLVAANKGYVTGYFSFDETYAYLSKQIQDRPDVAKPMVDRGELCFLHNKYADALKDLQSAEKVLGGREAGDEALASRLRRMMFETRLKLSEAEAARALEHVDAARPYIFNEIARARFHFARGAALAVGGRFHDAVDEYGRIIESMPDVKLEEDEASASVDILAQSRIGDLVEKQGEGVYARVDAVLKPKFDELVKSKDAAGLQQMQFRHPHSSLADNCLFEAARILERDEKDRYGPLRAQTLLRSLTMRYGRSEVLGEAYARLVANCLAGSQNRMAAVVLREMGEKHPGVVIPWEGKELKGADFVAQMMERKELQQAATALARVLPNLFPPLKSAWKAGSGPECLATVISDDSCFDRGIGLAAGVAMGGPPNPWFGAIDKVRAFDLGTGQTLWTAKVSAEWAYGDIENGPSVWGRNRYRAPVVCSGGVIALCHPLGMIAFDLGNGRQLWERKWTRPSRVNNPMMWFDQQQMMDHRVRQATNQRPVFASDGGRVFCYMPDGALACLEAATGKEMWKVKHQGYASGGVGLFGDVVVVATVSPANAVAYDALSGKLLYTKPLPGQFPNMPLYDRTRGRIIIGEGNTLCAYNAADFRQVWRVTSGQAAAVNPGYGQPWSVQVLPDNQLLVCRYTQVNNFWGYGLVMHDADTGKQLWTASTGKYERDANGFVQTTMMYEAVVDKQFVYIPVQMNSNKRVGNRFEYKMDSSLLIVDRAGGRQVRECKFEVAGTGPNKFVQLAALGGTSDHAVAVYRDVSGGNPGAGKLCVVSGETGKAVFQDNLPADLFAGQFQNLFVQRMEVLVTVDGSVLIPNGKGITCYNSTGVVPGAKGVEKPEEKKREGT